MGEFDWTDIENTNNTKVIYPSMQLSNFKYTFYKHLLYNL